MSNSADVGHLVREGLTGLAALGVSREDAKRITYQEVQKRVGVAAWAEYTNERGLRSGRRKRRDNNQPIREPDEDGIAEMLLACDDEQGRDQPDDDEEIDDGFP